MRSWTRRERGLGLGLVLMAVAAIAVPAWAAGDDEAVTEASGEDVIPAAVIAERERVDECMTEHGFGPGSQAGATIAVPLRGEADADEIPPLPEPSPAFKKAAEECGLPAPGEVMMAIRGELGGRGDRLCPLPLSPEVRELNDGQR